MSIPFVTTLEITAPPPSLHDNTGDIDRLLKALRMATGLAHQVNFNSMGRIAASFRACGFRGTALVCDMPGRPLLLDFLPRRPTLLPAVALDLGTTHLEAGLINLLDGELVAGGNRENDQICYGADILSRIHFAAKGDGAMKLREAIVGSISFLCQELAERAGIDQEQIVALAVSGNTTMVHLLLGLNPYHLIREPYIPLANALDPLPARECGFKLHPAAHIWVMPGIGSYFGGDLISGIVAAGLDQREETSMLIDVGTNAEVVIGNREWLIACAGAAGPALEGGVARMGMRAGAGAIEHVEIDPDSLAVCYRTIGNAAPRGICGSGMIDLMAAFYLARLIDIRGKFRPHRWPQRFVESPDGTAFVVAAAEEAEQGKPVTISQVDLDAMMRSKAAMYAILTTLTHQVGLAFSDLYRIYVAGAFGRHIDPRHAIVLGMLPDLPLTTFEPIGNSSLAGAVQVLLDREARRRCSEVPAKITYVELNVNQEFMIRFSGSRFIPHTDTTLFPSVPVFEQ